jgi:tetratricopeptide (TPR) repeat protein
MKNKLFFIIAFLYSISLYAREIGADYYYLGDYEKATSHLLKDMEVNPVESNLFLGKIAFIKGERQKAEEYYTKALNQDPDNPYSKIEMAKLNLKSDSKNVEITFDNIFKKHRKDANVALAIARAYLENNMPDKALDYLNRAKKIDSKNPDVYILEGDLILARDNKKLGEAASKYEMATYFAPDYRIGYMKTALVYENVNPNAAIEKLKTIIGKQPDYSLAYGYLGKIYTQNGFYPQAIDMFKSYFTSGIYTIDDIELYARALYFNNNFDEAKAQVSKGLQIDPDHFVLNRFLMYIDAQTKNIADGENTAHKFFALRDPAGYISLDYAMYGTILKNNKKYNEAISQYNKAIELDPDKLNLYAEAAAIARENKDYATAASFIKKQMAKKAAVATNSSDDITDLTTLGYDYYSAGISISKNQELAATLIQNKDITNSILASNKRINADSLARSINYFTKQYALFYLNKADSVFDKLIELTPDSYIGYRFKALTKHAINPETEIGLAKPYYEKVIQIITDKNELTAATQRVLLEAYNYLGYHYYMINDKPNTILYWNKVLEIDPNNKNAKLILDDIK